MTNRRRVRLHSSKLPKGVRRRKPAGPNSGGLAYDDPRRSHFPRSLSQGNENTRGNAGASVKYSNAPEGPLRGRK